MIRRCIWRGIVLSSAVAAVIAATAHPALGGTALASAPRCTTNVLKLSLGSVQGTAGSTYRNINFKNVGSQTCYLYGYPGVSLRNSGGQIGQAAAIMPGTSAQYALLVPGATVHAVLQIVDVGNYPPSVCQPKAGTTLRVYPPGAYGYFDLAISVSGCSNTSITYMYKGSV